MAASPNTNAASSAGNSRMLSPPSSLVSSIQLVSAAHSVQDSSEESDSFASLSPDGSSSEDEIVWSVSDLSASLLSEPSAVQGLRSPDVFSEDDFIVLGRPAASPPPRLDAAPPLRTRRQNERIGGNRSGSAGRTGSSPSVSGLSDAFSAPPFDNTDAESVRPTSQAGTAGTRRARRRRNARSASVSSESSAGSSAPTRTVVAATPKKGPAKKKSGVDIEKKARKKAKKRAKKEAEAAKRKAEGIGARPVVDDVSEAGECKAYDDAVQYISTFLSSPSADSKPKSDLTFLQALIVELGLCSAPATAEQSFYTLPSLPRSIKAAKALLKSNVFVNVRDYLDQRAKGLEALQKVMHPSRKALVKDLSRAKGQRKVPRDIVKNTGLGVLLVTCYS